MKMREIIDLLEALGLIEEDPKRIYRLGMCDAMALALHQLTKLPLGVFRGYFADYDGTMLWDDYHAAVVVDWKTPVWIDVAGVHHGIMNLPDFGNRQDVEVKLDPVTAEEMHEIFTTEGVTQDQIDEAIAFIENDPTLSEIVKSY